MADESALAPRAPKPVEEEYEVIAGKVFGLEPGEKFKRKLTPSEERLVGTHIRKVGGTDTASAADTPAKAFAGPTPSAPFSGPTKKEK